MTLALVQQFVRSNFKTRIQLKTKPIVQAIKSAGCLVWPLWSRPLPASQGGGGALPLLQLRLLPTTKIPRKWGAPKTQKGGSQIFSNQVIMYIFRHDLDIKKKTFSQVYWVCTCSAFAKAPSEIWGSSGWLLEAYNEHRWRGGGGRGGREKIMKKCLPCVF